MAALSVRTQTTRPSAGHAARVVRTIPGTHRSVVYRGRPLIMGILNVTPDSFSDGGAYPKTADAVRRGVQLAAQGANLIDIGGESTRPGAHAVPITDELRRTIPVIRQLAREVRVPLSIDTTKADVALRAIDAGASIVNDVSALSADSAMAAVVARTHAAVVLMHMRGRPRTMQRHPSYHDVVADVLRYVRHAVRRAAAAGISQNRILIDPGLGFGKTVTHNLTLLQHLDEFVRLGYPVVIGPSRKSFIGKTLGAGIKDRLTGTLACVAAAWWQGVQVVRVHDVRETFQLIAMLEATKAGHASR